MLFLKSCISVIFDSLKYHLLAFCRIVDKGCTKRKKEKPKNLNFEVEDTQTVWQISCRKRKVKAATEKLYVLKEHVQRCNAPIPPSKPVKEIQKNDSAPFVCAGRTRTEVSYATIARSKALGSSECPTSHSQ